MQRHSQSPLFSSSAPTTCCARSGPKGFWRFLLHLCIRRHHFRRARLPVEARRCFHCPKGYCGDMNIRSPLPALRRVPVITSSLRRPHRMACESLHLRLPRQSSRTLAGRRRNFPHRFLLPFPDCRSLSPNPRRISRGRCICPQTRHMLPPALLFSRFYSGHRLSNRPSCLRPPSRAPKQRSKHRRAPRRHRRLSLRDRAPSLKGSSSGPYRFPPHAQTASYRPQTLISGLNSLITNCFRRYIRFRAPAHRASRQITTSSHLPTKSTVSMKLLSATRQFPGLSPVLPT